MIVEDIMRAYQGKYRIWIKTIAMVVVCLFLAQSLSLDLLQERPQVSANTLAPELRLSRPEFKEEYIIGRTLLANRAVNKFTGDYIRETLSLQAGQLGDLSLLPQYKTESVEIAPNGEKRIIEIPVVGIPGLLKNTGQFGHVGLGKWNNIPVKYIDSAYFEIETDASKHETQEIAKWEAKRLELEKELSTEIPYQKYREVLNELGVGKELRDEFHRSSVGLAALYAEAETNALVDEKAIHKLASDPEYGGWDEGDSDFNTAAGQEKITKISSNLFSSAHIANLKDLDRIFLDARGYFTTAHDKGAYRYYRTSLSDISRYFRTIFSKEFIAKEFPDLLSWRTRLRIWRHQLERFEYPAPYLFSMCMKNNSLLAPIVTSAIRDPSKVFTVLDWGAGDGTAVISLGQALKRMGINNVRLIGFGDTLFNKWRSAPDNVEFIYDVAENLPSYFKSGEVDMVFSHLGLDVCNFSEMRLSKHLMDLRTILSDRGFIMFDTGDNDMEDVVQDKIIKPIEKTYNIKTAVSRETYGRIIFLRPKIISLDPTTALVPAAKTQGKVSPEMHAMMAEHGRSWFLDTFRLYIHETWHVIAYIALHPFSSFFGRDRITAELLKDTYARNVFLPPKANEGLLGAVQLLAAPIGNAALQSFLILAAIGIFSGPSGIMTYTKGAFVISVAALVALDNFGHFLISFVQKESHTDWNKALWMLTKGRKIPSVLITSLASVWLAHIGFEQIPLLFSGIFSVSSVFSAVFVATFLPHTILDTLMVMKDERPDPSLFPSIFSHMRNSFRASALETSKSPISEVLAPSMQADKFHPNPGGSPADYLVGVGENPMLQTSHTIAGYKEAVKPPVSNSTIRRDRQTLEERGYLLKGDYQQKKGYKYSLTEEGKVRFETINGIKQNAGNAVYGLVDSSFKLSDALENGDKVLFAMDEELGREGTERLVWQLIKDICGMKDSEAIEKKLRNIIFVKGRGKALADNVALYIGDGKDGIKVKKENVIMITKATNELNCSAFRDKATITFVDDSKLDSMDYYPFMEVALFTLAKALYNMGVAGYDRERLISIYKSLTVEQVAGDQIIPLIIDNKIVKITLRPIAPLNYDELRHIYRTLRELLQAA